MTEPVKPTPRTARSCTITESLVQVETQRLGHLFENSPSVKNTNRNSIRNEADLINEKNLSKLRSMPNHKHRQKKISALDDRIIINICGDRYETHRTTLELYPDSLLGNAKRRKYYYDKTRKEYFFDRHRACFEAILYYYQSNGRLRRPHYVPLDIFLEEVTFFQLGQEALNQIRKDENIKEVKKIRLPKTRIRRIIWATIEYPDYSLMAKIINIISLLMILISTIVLAVETLPQYDDLDDLTCENIFSTTSTISYTNNDTDSNSSQKQYTCFSYFTSPFFLIQAICVGFFTIELFLRILTTPSLFDFVKDLMNWIDVIAVIPFYITIAISVSGHQTDVNSNTYVGLRFLRILRLARVFKFFRVFKTVKSLRVLATTIRESLLDFLIMIIILTLLGFLFGAAAYYAENDSNPQAFDSIFKATYWGIISITGVGYGDITPITPTGRVIACFCALFGAATIGMLVSVLVDRYQRVFARKLYIKEEIIDFDDYSDDENNDTDSKNLSLNGKRRGSSRIEDPDARAIENARNENNSIETHPTPDLPIEIDENSLKRNNSRIHFIVGYVDNENQETSNDLVEKITSVVADKQSTGYDISLNIISNENNPDVSPFDVQFQLGTDDDDEDLTEINNGCKSRGNVLKTFQRQFSQTDQQLNDPEKNV